MTKFRHFVFKETLHCRSDASLDPAYPYFTIDQGDYDMTSSTHETGRGLLTLMTGLFAVGVVIAVVNLHSEPAASAAPAKAERRASVMFNGNGDLQRPTGYRKWTYVGTPLTPNDMNGGKAPFPEFHSVYMNPDAFDHYERTGDFSDGTVLVKELISVGDKEATSGKGYFMGDFVGLEVSIKDATRFRDEPGSWGYFSFGHTYPLKKSAPVQPAASCNDCHNGAADDDFVFTQYHPVLRATNGDTKRR